MENSRTSNSIRNSSVAMGTQIMTLFLQFLMQTIFIRTLGATYLGINGLFQNILSILAFSELGIGNAITFALFVPLKNKDEYKIQLLMNFFKKAYLLIGLTILGLTLVMLPFIASLVKGVEGVAHFRLYFFLYSMKSVVSYFFSYNRTLLIADQKGYKNNLNLFFFNLVQSLIQIFLLIKLHSFLLFLVFQIIFTLASNLQITVAVAKDYPFLMKKNKDKLPKKDLDAIKKSTLGLIGTQVGTIVVTNTNSLFISAFVGVFATGIYTSYMMIQQGVQQIINQAMDSVVASIGNLAAENNLEKSRIIFKKHQFIMWSLSYFCVLFFTTLYQPFITIWLGKEYVFPFSIESLLILNFYIYQNRKTALSFILSNGLFEKAGIKSVVEAIVNLIVCFVFLMFFKLGIIGVLLGTTLVNLLINIWFEPWLVYQYALLLPINRTYFWNYAKKFLFTAINSWFVLLLTSWIDLPSFLSLVVTFFTTLLYGGITYTLVYRKTEEYLFVKILVKQAFLMIKKLK